MKTTPRLTKELLDTLILETLREVLTQKEEKAPVELSSSTVLIGREGVLDSLGLVTLIVDVETKLSDQYGADVVIADDRAMSQRNSPFRTVSTLAEYITTLLEHSPA